MKKVLLIIAGVLLLGLIIAGAILLLRNKPIVTPDNSASRICQKINQEDLKYSCLAQVNNDEKFCNALDNNPKNVCLAALKKDDSFCRKVPHDNRQYCYQNLVSASGDATFCDKLNNPQEISTCYVHFISTNYYISNLKVINQSMCDKVLKNQPEHQLCLAMATQNTASCSSERIDCQALITRDLTLCSKSASKTDEGECYHNLAMLKKDSSICEKIGGLEIKDDCYRDYSRLSRDQTFCDKISNSSQKDLCLVNIALNIFKETVQ